MRVTAQDFEAERLRMVRQQLEERDISDPRVLDAMRTVPRHMFVPDDMRLLAYRDSPLPIGHEQTISQPYIVAYMTQTLELSGHETVLEVGTGSGYQTAILALLARQVFSLERHPDLADKASANLKALGFDNVEIHVGDGTQGLPDQSPFDAIIVTAAAPALPAPLKVQVGPRGRIVIPIGPREGQYLERWQRRGGAWHIERLAPVAFVPLVGRFGWSDHDGWGWF